MGKRLEEMSMREVYCTTMMEMAEGDKRVVALDADLVSPIGMDPFMKRFPDRMFNCGIQEANMVGVAAGMSARGMIPFIHTFAGFMSRKCLDQLYLEVGFSDLNVKAIGSDPGILALYNGASHMGFDDMGILMSIPNAVLLEATDMALLRSLLRMVKETYGLHYIRLNRKENPKIYDEDTEFEIGKGMVLSQGDDATIIASGIMIPEALEAAKLLKNEGYSVRVVDMFTWKPIDRNLVLNCAKTTGAIVTAENHNKLNGLGAAVDMVLCEAYPVPHGRIGLEGFGEVGDKEYLMKLKRLTAGDIAEKTKMMIAMKSI